MNGLSNYETCFNDTLLFLCFLINQNLFITKLGNITNECLNNELKTIKKYCYFKNYLLHSNAWLLSNNSMTNDQNNNNNNNTANKPISTSNHYNHNAHNRNRYRNNGGRANQEMSQ